MGALGTIRRLDRRDPAVAQIIRTWRALTGGSARRADDRRRTLLACSAGADSSALVLALAAAVSRPARIFVLAHIVHDLRPPVEAAADRDAAASLAAALGLPFAEAAIRVRDAGGNAEGVARRLRYEQLEAMAAQHGCPFIATAHHADDQLETLLMGLIRGAGPDGLRGVALFRPSPHGTHRIIRPMLSVPHAEAERICRDAGWRWQEDLTNLDTTRLRAAVRHLVTPELRAIRPDIARRAARSACLLGDAAGLVHDRVLQLWAKREDTGGGVVWRRDVLRAERPIVLGALLRHALQRLRGSTGRDRLTFRRLEPVIGAIRTPSGELKSFELAGAAIEVSAGRVVVSTEVSNE